MAKNDPVIDIKPRNEQVIDINPGDNQVRDIRPSNYQVLDIKPGNVSVLDTKPKNVQAVGESADRLYTQVLTKGMYMGIPPFTYAEAGTVESSFSP